MKPILNQILMIGKINYHFTQSLTQLHQTP